MEFQRLQSHFLFEDHFCLVRRPNEKGHVERLLDYARSNFLVPVPQVDCLRTLNEQLEAACWCDFERHREQGLATNVLFFHSQQPSRVIVVEQSLATELLQQSIDLSILELDDLLLTLVEETADGRQQDVPGPEQEGHG
jgi:hypothetical protein